MGFDHRQLTITHIWQTVGMNSVVYYASLVGLDTELLEAAELDGANRVQKVWYVMVPHLTGVIIILTILGIGSIFSGDFGLFYQVPMHSGMLYSTTQTIDTFVYRALLEQNSIGRSSAAGFFQSVLGFVLVMGANWIVNKLDRESALI